MKGKIKKTKLKCHVCKQKLDFVDFGAYKKNNYVLIEDQYYCLACAAKAGKKYIVGRWAY